MRAIIVIYLNFSYFSKSGSSSKVILIMKKGDIKKHTGNLELAKILSYNYLNKRFSSDKKVEDSLKYLLENKLPDLPVNSKKRDNCIQEIDKVIVICGAGLSVEAGLPLADAAIDQIEDYITAKGWLHEDVIKEEEGRIKGADVVPGDFETRIEAMSQHKYVRNKVFKKLADMYDEKHNPLKSCEIIAHMLKHRMIDGVINFNFDEILDTAIEEELHHDEYQLLVGGTESSEYQEQLNKFKKSDKRDRFYIKPHGTISDIDSIRATRDQYIRTTTGIIEELRKIFEGNIAFIIMGFKMGSIEFNVLIDECTKRKKQKVNSIHCFSI